MHLSICKRTSGEPASRCVPDRDGREGGGREGGREGGMGEGGGREGREGGGREEEEE